MITKILAPCPFCGNENLTEWVDGGCLPSFIDPKKRKEILSKTPYVTTCSIECESCGARIEGYAGCSDLDLCHDIYHEAINECYRKWNRRMEE